MSVRNYPLRADATGIILHEKGHRKQPLIRAAPECSLRLESTVEQHLVVALLTLPSCDDDDVG